ncbi:MAG: S8/S53 family peptidase [Nocardioides sp.]|uniref:S8/S53 family peptidase n=1 Tax=Nocardioides sp. TaxID=35761 RepID=UPI003F0946F7
MTVRPCGRGRTWPARWFAPGAALAALAVGGLTVLPVPLSAAPAAAAEGDRCDPAVLPSSERQADAKPTPNEVFRRLQVEQAHRIATGSGVTVAVVDSGVYDGPTSMKLLPKQSIGGLKGDIRDGHGTIVAGLIGGEHGMAPGARILPMRVYDATGADGSADQGQPLTNRGLADGLRQLAGLVDQFDIKVVNISLSIPSDPDGQVAAAVDALVARDVVVVAATGNREAETKASGTPRSDASRFPADLDNVLGVSAVGPVGTSPADYVLPNRGTDVASPTAGAVSYNANGQRCRTDTVATSWAAANVSGLVALLRQAYPDDTAQQIVARIVATTEGAGARDENGDAENVWTGGGVVQVHDALTRELASTPDGEVSRSQTEVSADAQAPPPPPKVDLFGSSRVLLLWGGLAAGSLLALAFMLRPLLRKHLHEG